MPLFNYLAHQRDCKEKQSARWEAIAALPAVYHTRRTAKDACILNTPISRIAAQVRNRELRPIDVLRPYGKRALYAHAKTNCLTEILIHRAEDWVVGSWNARNAGETGGAEVPAEEELNLSGPLAGVPVSLKDTVNVAGFDSCIGYSKYVGRPAERDAPLVRLLKDAGAVPFVKTNIPITLLSFESTNDVFGRTDNPHVPGYSAGGSTGGEAAILALGGSRIGVGTDVAGSVRVPAAWSGIYTIRCSTGRFPKAGNFTSMAGQEGVNSVYSPMAKSLEDLRYFLTSVIEMKPWDYDYTVHPIAWREAETTELEKRKVVWGVLRNDGVVPPTPAIERALDTTIAALKKRGDEVVVLDDDCPSCYEALRIASRLLNADSAKTVLSHFRSFFEYNDAGVAQMTWLFALPKWMKGVWAWWLRNVRRDPIMAGLVEDWCSRSVAGQWELVAEREDLRALWFEYLKEKRVDFILTPTNALPAVPKDGMKYTVASCGYTFLWNLLDYSAGVIPLGKVDAELDKVTEEKRKEMKKWNGVARNAWDLYQPTKMAGLPTAVQIVGGRLTEERVMWAMERAVTALGDIGVMYPEVKVEED